MVMVLATAGFCALLWHRLQGLDTAAVLQALGRIGPCPGWRPARWPPCSASGPSGAMTMPRTGTSAPGSRAGQARRAGFCAIALSQTSGSGGGDRRAGALADAALADPAAGGAGDAGSLGAVSGRLGDRDSGGGAVLLDGPFPGAARAGAGGRRAGAHWGRWCRASALRGWPNLFTLGRMVGLAALDCLAAGAGAVAPVARDDALGGAAACLSAGAGGGPAVRHARRDRRLRGGAAGAAARSGRSGADGRRFWPGAGSTTWPRRCLRRGRVARCRGRRGAPTWRHAVPAVAGFPRGRADAPGRLSAADRGRDAVRRRAHTARAGRPARASGGRGQAGRPAGADGPRGARGAGRRGLQSATPPRRRGAAGGAGRAAAGARGLADTGHLRAGSPGARRVCGASCARRRRRCCSPVRARCLSEIWPG